MPPPKSAPNHERPVRVFFSGGVGSTFRAVELLRDGYRVNLICVDGLSDPLRRRAVLADILKRFPKCAARLSVSIQSQEQPRLLCTTSAPLGELGVPHGDGARLASHLIAASLSLFAEQPDEPGVEDAEAPRNYVEYCGLLPDPLLQRIRPHLDAGGFVRVKEFPKLAALRYMRFPLAVHTRYTILTQARLEGWGDVLQLSDEDVERILGERRLIAKLCSLCGAA